MNVEEQHGFAREKARGLVDALDARLSVDTVASARRQAELALAALGDLEQALRADALAARMPMP